MNSPFSQFFEGARICEFKPQQIPGNLLLRLLVHEVDVQDQRSNEMWFEVDDVLHRFEREEFSIIIGLKFEETIVD